MQVASIAFRPRAKNMRLIRHVLFTLPLDFAQSADQAG
jgi:hypothetical protein